MMAVGSGQSFNAGCQFLAITLPTRVAINY